MTGTLGPRIPHKAEVLKYWIHVPMISGSTSSRWSPDPRPDDLRIHIIPMIPGSTSRWALDPRPELWGPAPHIGPSIGDDDPKRVGVQRCSQTHMIAVVVAAAAAASAVSSQSLSVILFVWGLCDCRSLELNAKLIATKKTSKKNLDVLLNKSRRRRRRRRSLELLLVQAIWILINNG